MTRQLSRKNRRHGRRAADQLRTGNIWGLVRLLLVMSLQALALVLVLVLVLAPQIALAGTPITAASLETVDNRTRVVLESASELRYKVLIFRYPERIVLELEEVALSPLLTSLSKQIVADHPNLIPPQIGALRTGAEGVQLEFGLKTEAEPSIRVLKSEAGQGYRLILDIVPTAALTIGPAPYPVDQARLPQVATNAPVSAPAATTAQPPATPRADDPSLVLLEVQLDRSMLADAITSYHDGKETFLPLGELARLLTLAIRTQPAQGTAEGFVLSEARSFNLNVAQSRLTLAERTQAFNPALVRLQSDDIYVASTLLSQWLPLDFELNLSNLTLKVLPRERLPLQERLERERLGAKAGARDVDDKDPGYLRVPLPYRLLGMPTIDQTFAVALRAGGGSGQTSASYTAYLTADLLGAESALYISSTQLHPSPDVRFTMARHDPDAGLLGPLRARSVMFGSGVTLPSVANISNASLSGKGYGLSLTNRPFTQPTSFDRHTLRGDLPPGWDVELYFNDGLIGFQSSRADGRYSFDDQPLAYGPNEFRLVFHGPLGQLRVERQRFLLEQSSTPPGAFFYNLAQHQDGAAQSRSVAQFEWGISKYLAATGGFVRLPKLVATGDPAATTAASYSPDGGLYSNVGLRAFLRSFIVSNDFFRSPNGGWLNESGLKTQINGVAMSYSHTLLNNFSSGLLAPSTDPLRTRDKLRLDGAIPAGFLPRLPMTFQLQREQYQSNRQNLTVTGRIAAYANWTSVSNQVTWQSSAGNTTANGVLQLSRRLGTFGLSGQLDYRLKPQFKVETISLAGDQRLGRAYLLNLGVVRSLGSRETLLTASLNKSLGDFGLGLSASYSSRGALSVGLNLFIAIGREPRQGQWIFDALPKADSGAASVRVFLDDNGNGVMDPGEPLIENVALTVNGVRALMRTDAAGIAWLDRLPTRQPVDIAVDTQTLEDPYWMPQLKGVRLVPRPGRVAELDFPIVLTSEIDGTVYFVEKTAKRGMGDVAIELLDPQRKVLSTIKSSSDGYYIVPSVVRGRYTLRVSPEQLKKLNLIDPGERSITIMPDGKFVNGVDFLIAPKLNSDGGRSFP